VELRNDGRTIKSEYVRDKKMWLMEEEQERNKTIENELN
jgi:hypothetical protein